MIFDFHQFDINTRILPTSVYGNEPYLAQSLGGVVSGQVISELRVLLERFVSFCSVKKLPHVFFRIDGFFNSEGLHVLEVNARFVDGWGIALNLSRAANISIPQEHLLFPELWHLPQAQKLYRNEFNLLRRELSFLGLHSKEVGTGALGKGSPVYCYGFDYPERNEGNLLVPIYGKELDDKLMLARFSWEWHGVLVKIPLGYYKTLCDWEDVPKNAIFKFRDKHGTESIKARGSVFYEDQLPRGNFLEQCYNREALIAQDLVVPCFTDDGRTIAQIEIQCCGTEPVCGYALFAPKGTRVVNDRYVHGPVAFW